MNYSRTDLAVARIAPWIVGVPVAAWFWSESVRALMRRRKIKPVAGYPRSQVEAIERTKGRRTDLEKDPT